MPLDTQILRDGENFVPPGGWDGFAVTAMILAAAFDSGVGPFVGKQEPQFKFPNEEGVPEEWRGKDQSSYPDVPQPVSPSDTWRLMSYPVIGQTPLNHGKYVLKKKHKFVNTMNSEVLELMPGDVLHAYRTMKH